MSPATTEVKIELDEKLIDKVAAERIKELERLLRNAENREKKAKDALAKDKRIVADALRIINATKNFAHEISEEAELWDEFSGYA